MKRLLGLGVILLAGCSNAPIAGTLDTLFPSRIVPKREPLIRPEEDDRIRPPEGRLPPIDPPGRRLPEPEVLPERELPRLRPLDELPGGTGGDFPRGGDLIPPPRF